METVSCNICGSTENSLLYTGCDLLLDHPSEQFTLVKCSQCGLIYQSPRPSAEEIGKYYPSEYEPYRADTKENWISKKANNYGVVKRRRMVTSLFEGKAERRLLDVGCSTGIFLNEVRQVKSWLVWGNDTSEYAVKLAREQYQLEVFHGSVAQANYLPGFFDVVTLWDVVEHLPDPRATISEIARITKPDGFAVLRFPNAGSLDAKIFRSAWAGLDLPRHFYVFSTSQIERMLELSGFRVAKVRCDIGNYPTFVLSLRFWFTQQSMEPGRRDIITRLLNSPGMKLLTAPLFYLYGLLGLGSEITVIAQKR